MLSGEKILITGLLSRRRKQPAQPAGSGWRVDSHRMAARPPARRRIRWYVRDRNAGAGDRGGRLCLCSTPQCGVARRSPGDLGRL